MSHILREPPDVSKYVNKGGSKCLNMKHVTHCCRLNHVAQLELEQKSSLRTPTSSMVRGESSALMKCSYEEGAAALDVELYGINPVN